MSEVGPATSRKSLLEARKARLVEIELEWHRCADEFGVNKATAQMAVALAGVEQERDEIRELARQRLLLILGYCRDKSIGTAEALRRVEHEAEHFAFTAVPAERRSRD